MTAPVRRRPRGLTRLRRRAAYFAQRIPRLTPEQLARAVVAQAALLWAQVNVWVRPTGQLVALGGRAEGSATAPEPAPLAPDQQRAAEAWALAVRRAAAYGLFRPMCLVRSVALNRLLEQHGVHGSRIRVGVRLVNGAFAAHAWVEHGAQVLGDDVAHVRQFAHFSEAEVLKWS